MTLSLDTSAVVDLLRGRRPEVRERFERDRGQGGEIVICSIVLFELVYGVRRCARPEARMRELDALLTMLPVMAFDGDDAMTAGALRHELESPGFPIAQADLLIAAQALNRDWTVVTNNVRDFVRTKVAIMDWRVSDELIEPPQLISRLSGGGEE